MKVYLVIFEDRHCDVQVEVYANTRAAEDAALRIAAEYDFTPEEPDEPVEGWMFHATLSGEGDRVRVQQAEVKMMSESESEKRYREAEDALRPKLTPEFLAVLHQAIRVCGWIVDMGETAAFGGWCYDVAGTKRPADLMEPHR